MNEQQKLMTMTGEGGPCLIYPQKTEKPKRIESVSTVLNTLYDGLDSVFEPYIGGLHHGVASNGDFLAEIDSLLNSDQGAQQNTANPTINTYPLGKPSPIFPNFLALCRTPKHSLLEALKEIDNWRMEWYNPSEKKSSKGISKHVLIITDQWNPSDFQPYEDKFRELAMHEDFWFIFILASNNGLYDISFLPHEFYKFTRHMPNSQLLENKDIDKETYPPNEIFEAPLNAQFEGLAEVNILHDGKKSLHFIVEDGEEKYCVTAGSYRGSGKTIEIAIAIGKWDDKRKVYSALAQVPYPINVISPEKKIELQSSKARTCVSLLSKLDGKPIDDIFKFYKNLSK